ncbi:hypothetical protein K440DRAFT_641989 [Wilcoxina mikolae CBS 423.85]|nr:hypothetical protein K440DRAFT_641989 [Wilcoxina mikolae CBS 423.85]
MANGAAQSTEEAPIELQQVVTVTDTGTENGLSEDQDPELENDVDVLQPGQFYSIHARDVKVTIVSAETLGSNPAIETAVGNTIIIVGLTAAAIAWAIKSYNIGKMSLEQSKISNNWNYWTYNLARMQARMSLVQLCLDHNNNDYNNTSCESVLKWELLPDIVMNLNPDRDNNSDIPKLGQGREEALIPPSSLGGIVIISTVVIEFAIFAAHVMNYLGTEQGNNGRRVQERRIE